MFGYETRYASVTVFVVAGLAALVLPTAFYWWNCPSDVQCSPAYADQIYGLLQQLGMLAALIWAAAGGIILYWVALQRQWLLGKNLPRIILASAVSMGGCALTVLAMPKFGPPCGAPPWWEAAFAALVLALLFSSAFSWRRKRTLDAFAERLSA